MERSYIVRDEKKERGWREMYDPVTFGFWYYNEFSRRNSWEAPLIFQKTFGKPFVVGVHTALYFSYLVKVNSCTV